MSSPWTANTTESHELKIKLFFYVEPEQQLVDIIDKWNKAYTV